MADIFENLPDHAVWATHVILDAGKLMSWGINTPDSERKTIFLKSVADALREVSDAISEIAAGGDRTALKERIDVALKMREKGYQGGVDDGELPKF